MASVKIVIKANRFAELAAQLRPEIQEIKRESAAKVKDLARSYAPVRTGRLRESIDVAEIGLDVIVGTDVFYGAWQEFGLPERNLPAVRYMGRARDEVKPEWEAKLSDLEGRLR